MYGKGKDEGGELSFKSYINNTTNFIHSIAILFTVITL